MILSNSGMTVTNDGIGRTRATATPLSFQGSTTTLDFTNLPYWDLCAALRPAFKIAEWAGDAATEAKMRQGHKLFVIQAFEKLPVK